MQVTPMPVFMGCAWGWGLRIITCFVSVFFLYMSYSYFVIYNSYQSKFFKQGILWKILVEIINKKCFVIPLVFTVCIDFNVCYL